tara:strand:+ start:1035 stop:1277 length:243 start_codon:yes stop_codon:yes gene_type:complete
MSPLTLFIIFIIVVTFVTARYTLNRLKEPVKSNRKELLQQSNYIDYWKNAETTNGRLAMMGLFALVVNYGLFGWIIPGFF